MVATNLHPDEWLRVRPLVNASNGTVQGYEAVSKDRSCGTQCTDIEDDFVGAVFSAGNPLNNRAGLTFGTAGGAFTMSGAGANTTERAVGCLSCINGGAVGNFTFGAHQAILVPGYASFRLWWRLNLEALATVGEDYDIAFGFSDNYQGGVVNPTTNGMAIRYSRATDGNFWAAVTTLNTVATKTVSTVAPTPGTFQLLEVAVNSEAQWARYYVDGAQIAAHYVPANVSGTLQGPFGAGFCYRKTAGVTGRNVDLDFFRLLIEQDAER